MKLSNLLICSLFLASSLYADITDRSTGVTFPSNISFQADGKEFKLHATGVSTRTKFFTKVYSVAHYIQDGATLSGGNQFQNVMQDANAKQLTIKWVHNASPAQIQNGYREAFASMPQSGQIRDQIQTFLSFFNKDMNRGDETVLRWVPEGHVQVLINGSQVGEISSKPFAEALWNIWLGPKSVVNRDQLLSITTQN